MTYSLSNNCTKNYYNRTLTVQVIVEDVVTWIFLRHSVVTAHTSQEVTETSLISSVPSQTSLPRTNAEYTLVM